MKIKSIELNGFKRMALNQIHHFKLLPTERVQLILGTNGSGKSSLIAELSPLPANHSNYTKTGSKIIEIDSNGHQYLISSDFSRSGQIHSFLKDNEELNPGGTYTVQKELALREFGIRQEVHDLMTGLDKFTQMSPAKRREWFTEMSETNYDYALTVYTKLKDTSRDINGALKLAKKRLVVETSKIAGETDLKKINEQIQLLVEEIDLLYTSRTEQIESKDTLESRQITLELEAKALCLRLFALQSKYSKFKSPEDLRLEIDRIKTESTTTSTKIEVLIKEHTNLKETHDACIKSGSAGLEQLKLELKSLQDKRKELLSNQRLELEFIDPRAALNALEALYPTLQYVFTHLPENKDRLFSQTNSTKLRQEYLIEKERLLKIDEGLEKLRHQKSHLDDLIRNEKTVCPKCSHQWTPGYSPNVYKKLEETIEELVYKRLKQNQSIKNIETKIEENTQYGDILKEYLLSVRSTPILNPFWNYLNDEEIVYTSPRQVEVKLELLKNDLNHLIQAQDIDVQIDKTKDLITVAIKSSDVDVAKVSTRLDAVETELGSLSKILNQLHTLQQKTQNNLARVIEFLELDRKIKIYQTQLESGVRDMIKAMRNELLTEALKVLQIELAVKQKSLNDIQMQQAIVFDIDSQVKELISQDEAYKLLVYELSPTDGLIAEGLTGFIHSFVKKMNIIIKKIWTYPLEVKKCRKEIDSLSGLDYKFPVLVNDENNIAPDVKYCSVGQKEVIDLAFKIIATQRLGLSEGPLVLDEFASSFDQEHRLRANLGIKSLLESMNFSQLWMVSHYHENYGIFTNAQVCVLSPSNIVVPKEHNEHVVMA